MNETDQGHGRLCRHEGWTMIGSFPEGERRSQFQKFKRHGHIGHWLWAPCQ